MWVLESPAPQVAPAQNGDAEAAKAMLEQARLMMEQARLEQERVRAEKIKLEAQAASTANAEAQEAREMMRRAQLMMEQAQQAQQAQQMQQAQLAAQPQPESNKEVDRLKAELESMRDLVNKLTVSLAQEKNVPAHTVVPQSVIPQTVVPPVQNVPPVYYGGNSEIDRDRERYRKLEDELERMRREIAEKEIRAKEAELDRRAKEAEKEKEQVKNITPEMYQMSEMRDPSPTIGNEFIALANGVFYSVKDKQVYVMTPATQAAIPPPKPASAPAQKRPVKKRKASSRRRPAHRRPAPHSGRPRRPGAPRPRR